MSKYYKAKSDDNRTKIAPKKSPKIIPKKNGYNLSFDTIGAILKRLDEKFCFTRFGDGELLMMGGWEGKQLNQFTSEELKNELIESFQIDDPNYLIGDSSKLTNEKFVEAGLFKCFPINDKLTNISFKYAKTKTFYNFISLHYLFVFFPGMFKAFIKSIQRKKIGIVGSNIPEQNREFFGAEEFVEVPDFQAYDTIDEWYPKIKKMDAELILFCAGISSNPAQKRLWDETEKSSIDIGSIVNGLNLALVPGFKSTISRTWIRMSLNELRRNYK